MVVYDEIAVSIADFAVRDVHAVGIKAEARQVVEIGGNRLFEIHAEPLVSADTMRERLCVRVA